MKKYPKRCAYKTRGAHWDADIEVEGAAIAECNGRYILDKKSNWGFKPMWHHERGACDPEFEGKGGGATIFCDKKPIFDGQPGESFQIFYRGGPRYYNAVVQCHTAVPTGLHWTVAFPGHFWDGLVNEKDGAAPKTKRAGLSDSEEAVLKVEAHLEAGCSEVNGDLWLVGWGELEADFMNWVIKKKHDPDAVAVKPSGGLFACCAEPAVEPPPLDAELSLFKDGVEVLDTITEIAGREGGPLAPAEVAVKGHAKGDPSKLVTYNINIQSTYVAKQSGNMTQGDVVKLVKESRSVKK